MTAAGPRYLALGDSYTIGEGVAERERWPVRLAELIRAGGTALGDPLIVARTGWTTDELERGIDAADPGGPFPLVSLLIGVNDQYRGSSAEHYSAPFRGLLERAIGLAGDRPDRVLVLSIPDWGVTPFAEGRDRQAIAGKIDRFNAVNRAITRDLKAGYVDVTTVSRERGGAREMLAADGLHPSGSMYRLWADLALPPARQALGTS